MPSEKLRISVTAAYRNGDVLYEERAFPGDAQVLSIPNTSAFRLLELRLVVPAREADEFLEGIKTGLVEMNIESMAPVVDRS